MLGAGEMQARQALGWLLQLCRRVPEAQHPDTSPSGAPPQGPGGSLECGRVLTPVRVKCSAWGLLAFAEDDTAPHAVFTTLSLLPSFLVKCLVTSKLDWEHRQFAAPRPPLYHLQLAHLGGGV